jgi:hypothetical protein
MHNQVVHLHNYRSGLFLEMAPANGDRFAG